MEYIYYYADKYSTELIIIACIVALFSIIIMVVNSIKTSRIIKKYKKLMRGVDGKNLETLLLQYLENMESLEKRLAKAEDGIIETTKKLGFCVQKVGIVRYNPFEQMGSDQSFSIALLNQHGDGVVISGLFSRSSSATYAKPILKMKSKYPLSKEEEQAIELAIKDK